MKRASSDMRGFAEHLIACEGRINRHSNSPLPPAFQVCDRLRPHLATFMGAAGFAALLMRALVLASAEVPALRHLVVNPDGVVEGLEKGELVPDPTELAEGGVVLLAHLLELLQSFIGENLTIQLVRDVWPKMTYNGLGAAKGDTK